jgi:hypothetical protein
MFVVMAMTVIEIGDEKITGGDRDQDNRSVILPKEEVES